MTNYDKVKILVVGDSGVGKTTLVHLITYNTPLQRPSWTVGVSLEPKLHEYKGGTPQAKTFFVDLWDVGGSQGHANSRSIFYNGLNGIILVHDLSNRKSEGNLSRWLAEIFASSDEEFDPEQFLHHPPILVVGTKLDAYGEGDAYLSGRSSGSGGSSLPTRNSMPRQSSIAQECGAEEIFLNCMDEKSLAPGSTAAVKLTRFFDKVIERRFYRDNSLNSSSVFSNLYDRKKTAFGYSQSQSSLQQNFLSSRGMSAEDQYHFS